MLAELLEHVVEERDAGRDARRARAVDRRATSVDRRLLRLAPQLGLRARSAAVIVTTSGRTSPSAARNASFSSGVPTVTRRQPSTRGHDEKSRTSTPCVEQPLPQLVRVAVDAERAGSSRPTGTRRCPCSRRRARRTAGRAPRRATRPAAPSRAAKSSATVPATCVGTDRLYGSSTFSSSAIIHAGATAKPSRTAGERPHLRVGAHDDERAVVVDELERAPRRELAVRLVDDEQRADFGRGREQPLDGLARLDRAGRVVRAAHEHDRRAASRAIGRDRVVGIDARSRRRARPRRPRCRCSRAICACSAYVGSNISARRPAPP